MDGTLLDSTPAVVATWEQYAREFNLDLEHVLKSESALWALGSLGSSPKAERGGAERRGGGRLPGVETTWSVPRSSGLVWCECNAWAASPESPLDPIPAVSAVQPPLVATPDPLPTCRAPTSPPCPVHDSIQHHLGQGL
jgi:hypothetical protein